MASFVLSFFTLDVLDEIWDLIESVSEGFLTYSYTVILVPSPRYFSAHFRKIETPTRLIRQRIR